MRKILKRWGDTLVITFTKEDRRVYLLKPGDIIEIEIYKIPHKKK